jgi:hypothetical protein
MAATVAIATSDIAATDAHCDEVLARRHPPTPRASAEAAISQIPAASPAERQNIAFPVPTAVANGAATAPSSTIALVA